MKKAPTNPLGSDAAYVKLEQRLLLVGWLNRLFGYRTNAELLADIKQAGEGFDADGRSYIYHHLVGRGQKLRVPLADLQGYDDNIRNHVAAINLRRPEPITLRYFQHLALLYAEVFLDWRFGNPKRLLKSLNEFTRDINAHRPIGDAAEKEFTEADLNKLAYWMATGGGKTLILHINLRQFLYYNKQPLDNILLITPNEGLSEQHLYEMAASGIPCERFSLEESGLRLSDRNTVRVIEITKLVEEKRGGGVSVPVEAFEGNNLIFVDEGHKGTGGEAWRKFRDALGQTGFTFEYSATFGQALTAARNDALTAEYGKAIVFDYSYRYFYGDGHGKDFHILNLKDQTTDEQTELLLVGNLLSFYEQQACFEAEATHTRPYNLEKPLWVFVGSSVNAVYKESGAPRSDVLTVARFLHHFLTNEQQRSVLAIQKIIESNTGLIDQTGEDVFSGRFDYMRSQKLDAETIYHRVLASVFHAPVGGALHICDIRGKAGELGLKAGGAEQYFGLIYIGDTSAFKNIIDDDSGIVVEEDVIGESLFESISAPDTAINVLIGAKKFMEGWNSWRVSNMGLLNIGRTEGSEIIQLFGRGVRLKGLGMSLKRSSAMDGTHPEHIQLLETLNIFAVRANYMSQFRDYLEREGVDTGGQIELPLAIRPNTDFLTKGLVIPRVSEGRVFAKECDVALEVDKAALVTVDMSLKVESMRSVAGGVATVAMTAGQERAIPFGSLDLVDWEAVYVSLLEFKQEKGFTNLVVMRDMPRKVLEHQDPRLYRLVADESVVSPRSFAGVAVLQEAVTSILRKYVEKYYRACQERWESANMVYVELTEGDSNFRNFTVRIPRREAALIAAVRQLIGEAKSLYEIETMELPGIHFDRHLYQPLLLANDKVKSDPPGLNEHERRFVNDLRAYCLAEKDKVLAGKEVFLLRNLSRGKGVGFFENEGFYPDFILWVKEGDTQRLVFVEPHGMLHEKAYWTSDKARLHERLGGMSKTWGARAGLDNVTLDSFMVSATPYDSLREHYVNGTWSREDFAKQHILFFDQGVVDHYPRVLFGA
ncbi:MAG: restriction endonuclease subunit R [Dehalococcoidia bacterium]|nr:restriction endonuclease subunit R [Dehalococcoidia bacterium]